MCVLPTLGPMVVVRIKALPIIFARFNELLPLDAFPRNGAPREKIGSPPSA